MKLELQGDREIVITRTFKAPARRVFTAWTRADLVTQWWAPKSRGAVVLSCEADVREGGRYRYVTRAGNGFEFAFSGEYREVKPYERLVYTTVFEPMADAGASIVTATFDERGGATLLTLVERYPSPEARTAALESGMELGLPIVMDQLDAVVQSLP